MIFVELIESRLAIVSTLMQSSVNFLADWVDSGVKRIVLELSCLHF